MLPENEIIDLLKKMLSEKRFKHSLNVASEAESLCVCHGGSDVKKVYLTGLIHDICKEIPLDWQKTMMIKSGLDITEEELNCKKLFHAPAGAYYCKTELGIDDEDILNAVRFHTVARKNMSGLEEIVYLADLVSAERVYQGIEEMRRLAYRDIAEAMHEALIFSFEDTTSRKMAICRHTFEAYNYYTGILNARKGEKI